MKKINGYNLPFDISKLKHRVDLIEQDGPLLSLYYNDKGDYYLCYWLDCDDNANRWMMLRVDTKTLYEYLNQEKTLLEVIKNPSDNFVWITDIDNNGRQIYTQALPSISVPEDYLPDPDSKFEFDHQQELLDQVSSDKFEIDIPKSDKSLFLPSCRRWDGGFRQKVSASLLIELLYKVTFCIRFSSTRQF